MKALQILAGPKALAHLKTHGLQPEHLGAIAGAAGGPKGLILGPLDRFIFGQWLANSQHELHLVGASIGAWRMATACLNDSTAAFERLEHDYIHQHYELAPGQKRVTAAQVSASFGGNLQAFFGGRLNEVLQHPRFRLHVMTCAGRHILRREHAWRTPLGYAGAYLSNAFSRPALGAWLERVVFSATPHLPFGTDDFRSRRHALTADNFMPAVQASCSIPFALQAVHDIPGASAGAYWDGGITDYHLHLNWRTHLHGPSPLVLYPHFQRQVIPGWFDKALRWRHTASPFLDHVLLLTPHPDWVKALPNGKLPDRKDFIHYANDLPGRIRVWQAAAQAAQQLADEWAQWLEKPDLQKVISW
jgi:hypothetical protein